jgi:hypothetical protein
MTGLKGAALSGGAGARLYRLPGGQQASAAGLQQAVVYYPLTTLMLAGCRDILIVNPNRPIAGCSATARSGASISERPERSNPMEFLPKSHLLGLLDAVENILAPRKAAKTATVGPLSRGLGYRTIQRGLRRSVQTQR